MSQSDTHTVHHPRQIAQVITGQNTSDGDGVNLLRVFGPSAYQLLDPFLLFDAFGSDEAADYIGGFPDHPHRGFETVTYMLAGNMQHKDSEGHTGNLTPGSVQWMTAGRGIIHSEMPQQVEGLMQGFQLWVNLPAKQKMSVPRYQEFPAEVIPSYSCPQGTKIKVIAGQSGGLKGPVAGVATQPLYLDINIPPISRFSHTLPPNHNAMLYLYDGEIDLDDGEEIQTLVAGQLAVLPAMLDSDGIGLGSRECEARFLLISGLPIGEPVAHWGPFVMNTREEIDQAMDDYRSGHLTDPPQH